MYITLLKNTILKKLRKSLEADFDLFDINAADSIFTSHRVDLSVGKADYQQFIDLLKETADLFNVNIAAYCLMPTPLP